MIREKLKTLRIAKGLSQEELASAIHLTSNTISNIETGKQKTLDIELLQVFANFYQIPITDLLTENSLTMNFHQKVENGYASYIQNLNTENKELINSLREQLQSQNIQLAEKGKQIEKLMSLLTNSNI